MSAVGRPFLSNTIPRTTREAPFPMLSIPTAVAANAGLAPVSIVNIAACPMIARPTPRRIIHQIK